MQTKLPETMAIAALVVIGTGLLLRLGASAAPTEVLLAAYSSNLALRTPAQRRNARLAANALNNTTLPPGRVFSFNKRVGSWSADRGYVRAPVSYDGELVMAAGGGVCQTSSTLYNAALLAGMDIVERHHHDFTAEYVPPGRDAAVAQYNIDLRFRNPYPWPVRIVCHASGNCLTAAIYSPKKPAWHAHLESEVLACTAPRRLSHMVFQGSEASRHSYVLNPGMAGWRVLTFRIFTHKGNTVKRQFLSDDTYHTMDRLVQVVENEKY